MTVLAGAIIAPALTEMAAYFENASDVLIKLIITMPALIIAVFGAVMGKLSDKLGRKNLLLISLVIYGIGGCSGYFIDTIEWLLVSRAVLGLGVAGIMSIATTLIGDYFKGSERGKFMGAQASFMSIGGMVFLLLGGFLADMNWRFPFTVYVTAFILLPFVMWIIYEPQKVASTESSASGIKLDRKTIYLVYFLGFAGMAFFYMIPTQIPFLLEERLEVSNTLKGLAIAIATITSAVSSINYSKIRRRYSYRKVFILTFLAMGLGYVLVAWFSVYTGILIGLAIAGLGLGMLLPNSNLWLMELAPIEKRGSIIGGMTSMFFLGQFVSPLIAALAINAFNLTVAFYLAAGLMIILTLVINFFWELKIGLLTLDTRR